MLHTSVRRELQSGETHSYVFELTAGQCARVVVEQLGVDVVIWLIGPDQKMIARIDRPNGSRGPESISLVARESGAYRLRLSASSPRGLYEIRFKEQRASQAKDEQRIAAESSLWKGEELRFEGTAESLKSATERFRQSAAEWRALGDEYEEALAWYGLGWSHQAIGEFQLAVEAFNRALSTISRLDDLHLRMITTSGLGSAHFNVGDNDGALSHFSNALVLCKRLNNRTAEARALYGIGWVQAVKGEDLKALESFLKLLPIRRAVQDRRGEAVTLGSIGDMCRRLGRYDEALGYLDQALQIVRTLDDRYAESHCLSTIGWVHAARGRYSEALDTFNKALDLRSRVGDRAGEATTLFGIASTLSNQGDLVKAREPIESSLSIIESLRATGVSQELRTHYFALVQEYYEFYIDLLMRLHEREPNAGYGERALEASERARCRSLLDLLSEARSGIREGADPALLERMRAVQAQLNLASANHRRAAPDKVEAAAREVDTLTRQYRMLEDQMRAASPAYAALTQARVLNAPELKAKLDEDTVLLEFALGRERSYGWAISRDRITAFRLPARDEIKRAAERLYQLVTAPRRGPARESPAAVRARLKREQAHFVAAASHFSNLMLGPVANELKGKRLVIVPGGELQHLPFAALPVPFCKDLPRCSEQSAGKAPAAAYIPLIAEHEVVILHSASVLASLRLDTRRQRPSKGIAVFADPVFSSDDERFGSRATRSASIEKPGTGVQTRIPRLFSTRAESDVILRNARAGQSLRVLDFEATRALATSGALADYLVIHFATHAFINNDHPELSAIALTALDKQRRPLEGFLRAHEIFNLKLNADLVVLSACKSGLGKEVRGEGLVGLTRAFMYAGAPRVIVSLWSLDDRATAELMARFYKHLLGPDKLTPSAALRAAQVEMWKDSRWSSPYYWAGFIQQGEWR